MMAFYQAKNYSLAYSIKENAWTHDLIFLNGNLATSRWWMPTVEKIKPTGPHSPGRMIFLELPGCGGSSALTAELDVHEIVNSYLEILKFLKVSQASIIGHSTGGILSALMMAKRPELFKKALLLDPVGPQGITFEDSVLEKYEEMKTNKELTAMIIAFTINNCDQDSEFFKKIIVEDTFASVQKVGSRMILSLRNLNTENEVKKVKTPTIVLFGEKDFLLPKAHAELLAQTVQNGIFREIPGAGHCLNIENPAKMAELIQTELG